ncbi:MAG: glycosyltransferase family protein [Nitrososphaerales archaeon]|uniref:Glycosyl transferase n=1 Tax=uncultured marine thaumarchaeote KM3_46_H07 TaxID=1456163 RepID=A0A075HAB2_9ARCH|nr:glycosyl transferase [uncultured marine thaumarchaeote KM3_46_H07]
MRKKKVYFPTFGSGVGHASRASIIASSLEEDFSYRFSSFKDGYEFLMANKFQCKKIYPLDISWKKNGTVSTTKTMIRSPFLSGIFLYHLKEEYKFLKKYKPDVVFSDSRLSPILCANKLKIPSIVILNQIKLLVEIRNKRRERLETINGRLLGKLWNYADEIFIPDLPPPYTICKENIQGVDSIKDKITYIGFITKQREDKRKFSIINELDIDKDKKTIYVQVSGPRQSRLDVYHKIIKQMEPVKDEYNIIISKGDPKGRSIPKKKEYWTEFEWCPWIEMFELSDCVIIRGGHSSIGNAISAGKPSIIIPIENQSEQIQNAIRVNELDLGIYMKNKEDSLVGNIQSILNENKFKNAIKKFEGLSSEYNGIEICKEKIREYS